MLGTYEDVSSISRSIMSPEFDGDSGLTEVRCHGLMRKVVLEIKNRFNAKKEKARTK